MANSLRIESLLATPPDCAAGCGRRLAKQSPDDTHRVGVPEAAFQAIQKGDTLEVVYSAAEDFVRVHKINPPAARA